DPPLTSGAAVSAWLTLGHARKNSLKDITVRFPLGRLVLITGVSGSGKSTLVRECLFPMLSEALKKRKTERGAPNSRSAALTGFDSIQSVYEVDQAPIGRTPRSIPATYVGFFDVMRQLFAQVPEARLRGYSPSRFSFNIAQVLELFVDEAMDFFSSIPKIKRPLQALCDTGLGYLKLGQTSPTLSGGEAQRVKLVTHLLAGLKEPDLFERLPRRNVFILEEPTIGLHMADVRRLV